MKPSTSPPRKTHHWPKAQCYYCGKKAIAWCDGVEHYSVQYDNGSPRISISDPEAITWCNRPLCNDHAHVVGMSTVSGSVDTIDYCPKHVFMQKNDIPTPINQQKF